MEITLQEFKDTVNKLSGEHNRGLLSTPDYHSQLAMLALRLTLYEKK
jgi:hypothetical protein